MRKVIASMNVTFDGFCDHTAGIANPELHDYYTDMLNNADKMEGEARIRGVIDAINKLKSALGKDQYSATATYMMARAYALVYRKGCSILLLKRLNDMQIMPDVASDAEKAIKRGRDDNSFKGFRKDADAAMGI